MLKTGNSKLGNGIWSFSLPAVSTCPGLSQSCRVSCYARRGHFAHPKNQAIYEINLQRSRDPDFVASIVAEIRDRNIRVVRVHVSGDFYSAEYVRKWRQIAARCRRTTFFVYTRSWRLPEILPELFGLAKHLNFFVWFSCDNETGAPPEGERIWRAYMRIGDLDTGAFPVDLVFRVRPKTSMKRSEDGTLVCPVEQAVTRQVAITCTRCGICYGRQPVPAKLELANPVL